MPETLAEHLAAWERGAWEQQAWEQQAWEQQAWEQQATGTNVSGRRAPVAATILAMANAVIEIAALLALGALAGPFGARTGKWGDTDPQRALDVMANAKVIDALAGTPVAWLVSEELDEPLALAEGGHLTVAVDPLDGASNADTNAAIGTIFGVYPASRVSVDTRDASSSAVLAVGDQQLAAGFAVYGPQTVLVLTLGAGTHIFTLDPTSHRFILTSPNVRIPSSAREFAINAANHFHWDEPIRSYVETCLRGTDGAHHPDRPHDPTTTVSTGQNMRWTGSFVAEVYRILIRGGTYLYPSDARPAYRNGRLRLAYEAGPVALIIEQAGGAASNGRVRLLDTPIAQWHQRTPVFAGSADDVAHIERLHSDPYPVGERSPLFARRGLFRV